MGHFPDQFGIRLVAVRVNFGITSEPLLNTFRAIWDLFGISLGSAWGQFGIHLESVREQVFGSVSNKFGSCLVLVLDQLGPAGITLGPAQDQNGCGTY